MKHFIVVLAGVMLLTVGVIGARDADAVLSCERDSRGR